MRISFLVNKVVGGWEPNNARLGGTEESVVQWAEELVKKGHGVRVYYSSHSRDLMGYTDLSSRVVYMNRHYYEKDAPGLGFDVCINVKSSEISPKESTLYLTNETNASELDLSAYEGVIWPSQWAVDNIPVNNKTFILPHGYNAAQIYPDKKIPKQCFYASSPDRGLEILLEAWPKVYKAHPDATLIVTYGGNIDLPGVINMGEIDQETMNDIYKTSDIWCHPATGGELFCMTGKKAQAAGCIPVIIPTMALSETVERGFKTDKENYAQTLMEVLGLSMEYRDHIRQDIIKHANAMTWEESTDRLLEIINSVLK